MAAQAKDFDEYICTLCNRIAADMNEPEAAALSTLELLETRLHRLEFLLTGASNDDGVPDQITNPPQSNETIWAKLDALEAELARLKKLSGTAGAVVRDIERLCVW